MKDNILKIIDELEKVRGTDNPYWNLSREAAVFVNILVRALNAKNVLEVGTSNGYSGLFICDALVDTGGKLYTIESHVGRFELAGRNFERAMVFGVVTQIKGHAPEIVKEFFGGEDIKFDLVLLDATKRETVSYIEVFEPFLKKGTVIVTDNINSHRDRMQGFLDYMRSRKDIKSTEFEIGSGMLVSVII